MGKKKTKDFRIALLGVDKEAKACGYTRPLDVIAFRYARLMHKEHFDSRRGVFYDEDMDWCVHYNNNPYAVEPQIREIEIVTIERWCKEHDIEILGMAYYPKDRYSFAMVLATANEKLVSEALYEIYLATFANHDK